MANVIKRQDYYFDNLGDQNTTRFIEAVSKRLEEGGIKKANNWMNGKELFLENTSTRPH